MDSREELTRQFYEYIVLGCGGVESGAVYWLSKRAGSGVLGLEQFKLGHDNGGAQDHSRLIRRSYHSTNYIKLLPDAYKAKLRPQIYEIFSNCTPRSALSNDNVQFRGYEAPSVCRWEEIEQESGLQILYKTGGLMMSRKDFNPPIKDLYMEHMDKHNIPHEKMDGTEIRKRFPQFTTDETIRGYYEESAGFVDAALGNAVHTQLARSHGATIIDNCTVTNISRDSSGRVNVFCSDQSGIGFKDWEKFKEEETDSQSESCDLDKSFGRLRMDGPIILLVDATKGRFQCRRLIVAAGAWMNGVLNKIGVHIPITVTQEQVTYLGTPHIKDFTKERFPVWFYLHEDGLFYGSPIHGNAGPKVSLDWSGPVVSAESRTFIPDKKREDQCIEFLKKICPKAVGPLLYTKTCLFAMTPDRNFVLDSCHHAGWPDVFVTVGAGHAYKFASLLGKILSQLAIDDNTEYDLSIFSITREAMVDPNLKELESWSLKAKL